MSDLLRRAFAQQGHMSEDELRWLHDACKDKGLVIELGSWCGRSSLAMASARRLICVDSWKGSPGEECEKDVVEGRVDPWKEWCDAVTEPECVRCNIIAEKGDLWDAEFRHKLVDSYGATADLVFIDASHDERSVRQDITMAMQLLKPGGVLCGHDYGDWTGWPGVKAAVDALVRNPRVGAGSIWVEGE